MTPETLFSTRLFYASFICYAASLLVYLLLMVIGRTVPNRHPAVIIMLLGFIFHTLGIAFRSHEFGHLPLANMFEYLLVSSWFAAAAYFYIVKSVKSQIIAAASVMVIVMLMLVLSLLPKEGSSSLMPALRSYWLYIHVSAAAASEGLFAIGFVSSALCVLKSIVPQNSAIGNRLPERAILDVLTYRTVITGYLLFTLGALFAGSIWAHRAWGSFWSWDPKETCSLIVWLIYSAYIHVRRNAKQGSLAPHFLSIAGFIAALLTFFSSMFLGGMHSYG